MARKKYSELKEKIIELLKEKKQYEEVDDTLIDQLIFTLQISDNCKKDILKNGITVNVTRDPSKDPFYQSNPSVNQFFSASKMISSISTKLGITPADRKKLKINDSSLNNYDLFGDEDDNE